MSILTILDASVVTFVLMSARRVILIWAWASNTMTTHRTTAFLLSASLFLGLALTANALSGPKIPQARGEKCVEPVEMMRRNHMEFLKHKRDATMRWGIRTEKHSLIGCIECHAAKGEDGKYIPVNDPDQACRSCHDYTAVTMDCFSCHATVPKEGAAPAGSKGDS
tara:strand:- start:8684 stop:9181 length:498 start_codon:yes stop_codon:yes gene_type:complete